MPQTVQESVNSTVSQKVLSEFSRPGWPEVVIYLLCGLLLLLIANVKSLWEAINNSVQTTSVDTSTVVDEKLFDLGNDLNGLLSGRLGQMLFWAMVGCLIYVLIWLVQNFIINLRNDVVSDKYLHPKAYNSSSYWEGVIAHKIFFGAVLVTFALYLYFAFLVLMPVLSKVFYNSAVNFSLPASLIELTIITVLSGVMVYIGVFLAKLIIHSWRTIVNNF